MKSIRIPAMEVTGENHDSAAVDGLQHGLLQFLLGQGWTMGNQKSLLTGHISEQKTMTSGDPEV